HPADGAELHRVLELLCDEAAAALPLDPSDPAHEPDWPITLGDLEPDRPSVFPVGHALDDAPFRQEVADPLRADAGPAGPLHRGGSDGGVVVLDGFEVRQYGPDVLRRTGGFELVMNRRHVT